MATVFVYGTLMADDVLRALIKRVPKAAPALLPAHARYAARGRVYPGMVPDPASSVRGRLLFDLDKSEMAVFDAFEGDEYAKQPVTALQLARDADEGGAPVEADAYIWVAPRDELAGEWSYGGWVAADLERYAAMCAEFAAEFHAGGADK